MSTAVRSIIRSVCRKPDDKLNIVIFSKYVYEQYNTMLSKTGHNFFLWTENYGGRWTDEIVPKPPNFYYLPQDQSKYDQTLDFDLIIMHNRLGQFDIGKAVSNGWHLPTVMVHHEDPERAVFTDDLEIKRPDLANAQEVFNRQGHINIFNSERVMNSWRTVGPVIRPGIDYQRYCSNVEQTTNRVLLEPFADDNLNNFIFDNLNPTILTKKKSENDDGVVNQYNLADIFINLNHVSFPISVLEAMACSRLVISVRNPILEEYFKDNEEIIYAENPNDLIDKVKRYLYKDDIKKNMGKEASNRIMYDFSLSSFVNDWNGYLENINNIVFMME